MLGGVSHSLGNIRRTKLQRLAQKGNAYRGRPENNVMVKLDDCEVSDERGNKNYLPYIYFIFTAITGFAYIPSIFVSKSVDLQGLMFD